MKKVILLAGLFLIGISAQAITNHEEDVASTPGKNKRYTNTQEISFVENGILFTIATDGYFDYDVLHKRPRTNYIRRNNHHTVSYNYGRRGNRYGTYTRREYVHRDWYGNIIQINRTPIKYKKNGKVRSIGNVRLKYHRGRLVSVGELEITYNRFGDIRDTFGFINAYNDFWHDGCNLENVDHWERHREKDDDRNDRNTGRRDKIKNRRN